MAQSSRIIKNIVSGIWSTAEEKGIEGEDVNLRDNVRRVALGSDHGGTTSPMSVPSTRKALIILILQPKSQRKWQAVSVRGGL
jgi:hypothetical protein